MLLQKGQRASSKQWLPVDPKIPRLSEPLLSSPHPPASSLTGLAFFLLPGIRTPTSSENGAGPGLPFNLLNAEKCGRGQDASLGPRLDAAASIYTHVSSASEKDDPQGIKECGNKPCWKPQLLAKKPSPLHFFKPLGRIIFIFTTALKKHSRKETKAKREQRPRIIL